MTTLRLSNMQQALQIGFNIFALKLVAESMPTVWKDETSVEVILTAKNGSRWKLSIEPTTEEPTPGDGAL